MFLCKKIFLLILTLTVHLSKAAVNTRFMHLKIIHNSNIQSRILQVSANSGPCVSSGECFGGLARIFTFVANEKLNNSDVLFLNTGNTFAASIYDEFIKNEMGTLMSQMGLDAVALGHRDIQSGIQVLSNYIRQIKVPVLCANLDISYVPELHDIPNLKKWEIFRYPHKNLSVAVIGFLPPQIQYTCNMHELQILPLVKTINNEIKVIKSLTTGTDLIIIALGEAYDVLKTLLVECPEIDIVIKPSRSGVMSNNKQLTVKTKDVVTKKYPKIIKGNSGKGRHTKFVIDSYSFSMYIGMANVKLDRYKNKVKITGDNLLLDETVEQNENILKMVKEKFISKYTKEAEVIGFTKNQFDSKSCSEGECALFNLITEAMVFTHVQSLATVPGIKYWTDASIAFMSDPGYDIRLGDKFGNITVQNLGTIIPKQENYNIIEVGGQTIISALEHSANRFASNSKMGTLHMFGARVVYNLSSNSGNRLKSVHVLCTKCYVPMYEPLMENQAYKIIIPDNLFYGAHGYRFQEDREQIRRKLPLNDVMTLWNYIQTKKLIYTKLDGRIQFTKMKNPVI